MTKKILIWVACILTVLCIGYTIYSLGNSQLDRFRLKYQTQGKDITLQQMILAADQKQDITINIDGKTYKFVGINQSDKPIEPAKP